MGYETLEKLGSLALICMSICWDVFQKALAAGAGSTFTPVCFSYGGIFYAIMAITGRIVVGNFLPEPESKVKLINLSTGVTQENKNWALARLVRDLERRCARASPPERYLSQDVRPAARRSIRITVYRGYEEEERDYTWQLRAQNRNGVMSSLTTTIHGIYFLCILQLSIAAIPILLIQDWDAMMVTVVGNILVQLCGWLPQWSREKLSSSVEDRTVALTQGKGSLDVIVIIGSEGCLDLEVFAKRQDSRTARFWEGKPSLAALRFGLPVGYWLSLAFMIGQCGLWLAVFIKIVSKRGSKWYLKRENNWYLIVIGLIGLVQNIYVANVERHESQLGLRLVEESTIEANKVMDGIMDFETEYGKGRHLLPEFFPSTQADDERLWWEGQRESYDTARRARAA